MRNWTCGAARSLVCALTNLLATEVIELAVCMDVERPKDGVESQHAREHDRVLLEARGPRQRLRVLGEREGVALAVHGAAARREERTADLLLAPRVEPPRLF